jgi:hypothetical protein
MNTHDCPVCNGEPTYLGSMGRLVKLRCRACRRTWAAPMPVAEVIEFDNSLPLIEEVG